MKVSPSLGLCMLIGLSSCVSTRTGPDGPAANAVAGGAGLSRRAIVRRVLQHNVRLVVHDGKTARRTASGVVIASEPTASGAHSYVLTNAHALDTRGYKTPRLTVLVDRAGETMEYEAEPVAMGTVPDMDLALLRVRGVSLVAAELAEDAELEPGEDVMVIAAPYGKALSVSGGMISQVEWDRRANVPWMLKTDAPIGYGASGGGVYSRTTGKLVAIVEGYRTAKVGFAVAQQNYSFDVPMPGETFGAPTAKVRAFLTTKGFGRFVDVKPLWGASTAHGRPLLGSTSNH
jgi:serine protease Do